MSYIYNFKLKKVIKSTPVFVRVVNQTVGEHSGEIFGRFGATDDLLVSQHTHLQDPVIYDLNYVNQF